MEKSKKELIELTSKHHIIIFIVSIAILIPSFFLIKYNVIPDFIEKIEILALIYMVVAFFLIPFVAFMGLIFSIESYGIMKYNNYRYNKKYKKAKEYLPKKFSNEFKEIKPITEIEDIIPKDKVKCVAKIDENGKLIFKVEVNFEEEVDYAWLYDNFDI